MVNLILILLLLHYIGLYIFKPKMDSFYCGIGGYIGNNFNKYKFNILGLYNDSRGGDSCGVLVNNNENTSIYYGHDKTKYYKALGESGGLKEINLESPNFALLHCRKASIGGIGLIQAQPIVIKDKDGNIVFAMIHNGTLINYRELADKYDVDFTFNETDSQIFCKTIFKVGYGVLSEYDGAGAFVFWDRRDGNDTIKVFKGASLFYENDNDLYVERPLFCIKEKNSFWFSSMEDSLQFINDTDAKIESVKHNTLFTIKNGKIIAEDHIDRSKQKQTEKLQVNWEKQRELNKKMPKPYYDDYDEVWGSGYNESRYRDYGGNNFGGNLNASGSGKTDKLVPVPYICKNKIHFDVDGLYYLNGLVCNGMIESTPAGYVDMSTIKKDTYYFLYGVLMHSYFDYLCAVQYINQTFAGEDEYIEMYLAAYSPSPVPYNFIDVTNLKCIELYGYNKLTKGSELFDGYFEPFFNYKRDRYLVKGGEITWHYEYNNISTQYIMPNEKIALDTQILSGQISKNQLKKMIKNNLKGIYAKY